MASQRFDNVEWQSHVPLDVRLFCDDVVAFEVRTEVVDVTTFSSSSRQYVAGRRRVMVELSGEAAERIGEALVRAFDDRRIDATALVRDRKSPAGTVRRGIDLSGAL